MNALKEQQLTATSLAGRQCLSNHNDIPRPGRHGPGTEEAALIRKIVGGQRELFGDLIAPHLTALSYVVYATATNIIAYLPFLMLTGSTGDFLYSLPIVMTAALSRGSWR
jgi:hypothetical protein